MTRLAERLVRFAARLLPALARERYREEWLADLDGAAEAGVTRSGVVAGAFATAITISRTAPALTGLTLGETFTYRFRVASGLLASAAVFGAGYVLYGGYSMPSATGSPALIVVGQVVLAIAIVLAAAGVIALIGTVAVAIQSRRVGVAIALLLVPLAVPPLAIAAPFLLIGGFALAPLALIGLVVAVFVGARGGRVLPAGRRVLLAGLFGAAALAVCALSVMHVAVWNPLARIPGLDLDEIYAELAAAGEASGVGVWLVIQAAVTVVGAVGLLVLTLVPRRSPLVVGARRIVAMGFLLIATTTLLGYLPAFSMGMGLADTFLTTGGDAAASGPLLGIVGQAALVAALLAVTVRPAVPRAVPLPPPTGPARA